MIEEPDPVELTVDLPEYGLKFGVSARLSLSIGTPMVTMLSFALRMGGQSRWLF